MGIMDLRVIITVVSFVVFLLIVWWAYSSRQKERFDEAANLPFADDDMQARTVEKRQSANGSTSSSNTEKQEVPHG